MKQIAQRDASTARPSHQPLVIEFLYLDLTRCTRCRDTDRHLEEALSSVRAVLQAAGREIDVKKIHTQSEGQARELGFVSSPTIRVDGRDIAIDLKESECTSCGGVCGEEGIACRVWNFHGTDYDAAPAAMIVDAVLREIYGGSPRPVTPTPAPMSENLARFFAAKTARGTRKAGCC